MIAWYGLGGTLSYDGGFMADFKKVPQRVQPFRLWDDNHDNAVFWQLTETLGIYQKMYLTIGGEII